MKKVLSLLLATIALVLSSCGNRGQKQLSSISLSGEYQTQFTEGDVFNHNGLVVTANYSDSTSSVVTNYIVSTPDMSLTGNQDVLVSYTESSITKTNSYKVTIHSKSVIYLTGISLSGNYQTEFLKNSTFSYSGLIVTASYGDSSSKQVTSYSVSSPDMSTLGSKEVVVSFTEGGITKTASYSISVVEGVDPSYVEEAKATIRAAFNELDSDDYNKNRWVSLVNKLNNSLKALDQALSEQSVDAIVADTLQFFIDTPTIEEITKGTWFDYRNSDAYSIDRDELNLLTIAYDKNPGHWVHVGTRQNLITDVTVNNKLILRFRNDVDQNMQVCLQITDDSSSYKCDSGIVNIAPFEEREISLNYDVEVCKLYFFVDSCDDTHTRSGQITILETKLEYEKREPVIIKDPKTVSIDKSMTKEDATQTVYTLLEDDTPFYVERVSALVEVDYNGNGSSGRWFGLHLYAGNKHASISSSEAHSQEIKEVDPLDPTKEVTVGGNYIFNFEIASSSKLSAGQTISMDIAYAAGPTLEHPDFNDLKFKVKSYTLYYGLWKPVETEEVNVDQYIYKNSSSKDESGNTLTAKIPYSSFTKTGRVSKMTVNFTTLNMESYGKSSIYVTNFEFTNFKSGNNNILDVGSKMDTTKSGETISGSVDLYPTRSVDLSDTAKEITMVCWWSSAKDIKIDSVIMHTDNMEKPEPVTALEAHSIDSGVVLTWTSSEYASQYEVYMDGTLNQTVSTSYATVEDLVNGENHTFEIVAKNSSGSSEPVSVVGHAEEGAVYDMFIEGLNTDLERNLGSSNVGKILNGSNYWASQSNNEKLKRVLAKMEKGDEETTIAYMGGSITVGEKAGAYDGGDTKHQKGYAYYSYQWLKRTFDKANKSKFVNASISGTGTEIGLVRAKKDVLEYNPDLIFIEFAANNGSTEFDMSSYESLLRMCMKLPSDPAIILLFSFTDYSNFESGTEKKIAEIGSYYHLPMVSFSRGMMEVCSKPLDEDPVFQAFSPDGTHPNHEGHQLYGKAVAYFIRTLNNRTTDEHFDYPSSPSHSDYDRFENIVTIDNTMNNEVIESLGSFYATDTSTPCTSKQSDVTAFQTGWKKTDTTVNEPMVIKVNARNFLICNEAGNPGSVAGDPIGFIEVTYVNDDDPTDTGTLSWDMSKTAKQNISGSMEIGYNGNGWQNPCCIRILDKDVAADYTITIKMTENTGICTIFAMGYTK